MIWRYTILKNLSKRKDLAKRQTKILSDLFGIRWGRIRNNEFLLTTTGSLGRSKIFYTQTEEIGNGLFSIRSDKNYTYDLNRIVPENSKFDPRCPHFKEWIKFIKNILQEGKLNSDQATKISKYLLLYAI